MSRLGLTSASVLFLLSGMTSPAKALQQYTEKDTSAQQQEQHTQQAEGAMPRQQVTLTQPAEQATPAGQVSSTSKVKKPMPAQQGTSIQHARQERDAQQAEEDKPAALPRP